MEKQALELIEELKDEISVILLDLIMPEMDGKQVLAELNKRKIIGMIPVLVISGENSYETEKECFDLGISDYIAKPFNNVIIQKRVKNVARLYEYKLQLEEKGGGADCRFAEGVSDIENTDREASPEQPEDC